MAEKISLLNKMNYFNYLKPYKIIIVYIHISSITKKLPETNLSITFEQGQNVFITVSLRYVKSFAS